MNELAEYNERREKYDIEAQSARLADDAVKYRSFRAETAGIESHTIPAARLGREIGLSFQAYWMPAKEEMAVAWFNEHYAKHLGMSYTLFKWFIKISKKLPEKIESMSEVWPAFQMLLWAGEALELNHRSEPQQSHDVSPYVFFFKQLRGLKVDLTRRMSDAENWDTSTRESVKQEIHTAREWLEQVERDL